MDGGGLIRYLLHGKIPPQPQRPGDGERGIPLPPVADSQEAGDDPPLSIMSSPRARYPEDPACEEWRYAHSSNNESCESAAARHQPRRGAAVMNIAFCHENVLPSRGGCETYIAGLARRLVADGHEVHLYASRWDARALPEGLHYHPIVMPHVPRFLRPWAFGAALHRSLASSNHAVTVGFDKVWGVDILYPQGGLYVATARHNLLKYRHPLLRRVVSWLKAIDPAHRSFMALEQRQYAGPSRPLVVAISDMVRRHFNEHYRLSSDDLRLVRLATDLDRFSEVDRPRRRLEWRQAWGLAPEHTVALFAGLNYRLKGLEPLLHAIRLLPPGPFRLLVAGHPNTTDFVRLAKRLGVADRVHFVGYIADMRNCYFAADFFVHPTFYDPCSHVVLEAMACGLPVITSRFNGACELMHPPREGFVIDDPHNHADLARFLNQLLDPATRAACGQTARKTASLWTFDHHYRQMLAVFAEAAARKQAA
jgi:UDP-glucose:(heptosyl)LPS alpha-1,3-glucosyltransferase